MRRIAHLGILLPLAGCGSGTWLDLPFTTGSNPNRPAGATENMQRVLGEEVHLAPLTPEPGDVWPGPLEPEPTLQDLEKTGNIQPGIEQPVPGSPQAREAPPPPNRPVGSSTPPGTAQPGLAPLPSQPPPSAPSAAATAPPARNPAGQAVQTPRGTGVTTGGTQGYQTMTLPGGGSAIVVPNGNGTSTVIKSDGTIETIPTPR
ncbi:MAG: hypothetical protein JO227_12480 [Acetobacteraceae bacterium]|nr:hypothetical protein [Acetobacteraceae bacterium]